MKTLDQCKWKAFKIEDIFKISGTTTTHPSVLTKKGKVPRITCAATNNGLDDFYNNSPTEEGGVLTIDSATVGYVGYQAYDFLATDHVEKLILKDGSKLSRYVALFIKMAIDKACNGKYGYGYKFAQQRIRRQTLQLPVTPKDEPDWAFMEEYMKAKEHQLLAQYQKYIAQIIDNQQITPPVNSKQWRAFRIEDIFDVKNSVRLTKSDMSEGSTPFIGASDSNNGITAFVSNNNSSRDSNVLGVNYNGSVVENFYHPYTALFSDDVKRLHLKGCADNKYTFLFMKNAILQQKVKFQYGYKFNSGRMNRQYIMLPITPEGTPDYEYMAGYMKNIENRIIQKYINVKLL
ncbi:MAG: restriction endonuclease subunit S [Paludibacteraceae bacterium]|nr:restriction endonuclease subunit S [Paludibacteraceae bacterium]